MRRWTARLRLLARSRWIYPALFLAALAETTLLPFPIEAALAALMLARRDRIPVYWSVTVAATLAGSALLYGGAELARGPLAALPGLDAAALEEYGQRFAENGFWTIVLGGIFPTPWTLVALAAGAADYSFAGFMGATLIGRGVRFGLVAAAVWLFGGRAARYWRRASPARKRSTLGAAGAATLIWIALALI